MGVYAKPMAITKVILPGGKVDTDSGWGKPQAKRVLSDGVAYEVSHVLQLNAQEGTGAGSCDGTHPCAGKTGTTENHADAWYDGYTRQLSTVVWMGYPKGEIPMLNVHGVAVAGATFSVPIWHEYMAAALWHRRVLDFPNPRHWPVWRSFTRGNYGSFGSTSSSSSTYSQTPAAPVTTTATHTAPPPPPPKRTAPPPAGHTAPVPTHVTPQPGPPPTLTGPSPRGVTP
jgi:membrane peptidoglycan carboxypeptidase